MDGFYNYGKAEYNKIVDNRFDSVVQIEQENGSVRNVGRDGYGTTGYFTSDAYVPVYIVAETEAIIIAITIIHNLLFLPVIGTSIDFSVNET